MDVQANEESTRFKAAGIDPGPLARHLSSNGLLARPVVPFCYHPSMGFKSGLAKFLKGTALVAATAAATLESQGKPITAGNLLRKAAGPAVKELGKP